MIYRPRAGAPVTGASGPPRPAPAPAPPAPATASLRRDHDLIEKVARAMEASASLLRRGVRVPAPVIGQVVEFTGGFADACHHGKEEDSLFPALERAGMPSSTGPIAVMLAEHEKSREIAGRIRRAAESYGADGSRSGELAAAMEEYASHISEHIWKENNRLFMMADARLAPAAGSVAAGLDAVEAERLARTGADRGHYERIAAGLSRSTADERERLAAAAAAAAAAAGGGPSVEWEQ